MLDADEGRDSAVTASLDFHLKLKGKVYTTTCVKSCVMHGRET